MGRCQVLERYLRDANSGDRIYYGWEIKSALVKVCLDGVIASDTFTNHLTVSIEWINCHNKYDKPSLWSFHVKLDSLIMAAVAIGSFMLASLHLYRCADDTKTPATLRIKMR